LEIPSALPNTGGEGSGGGVINWLAIVGVFLMLIGIGALISSALRK
jgi:predicted membrane-bound spermidine synthase